MTNSFSPRPRILRSNADGHYETRIAGQWVLVPEIMLPLIMDANERKLEELRK